MYVLLAPCTVCTGASSFKCVESNARCGRGELRCIATLHWSKIHDNYVSYVHVHVTSTADRRCAFVQIGILHAMYLLSSIHVGSSGLRRRPTPANSRNRFWKPMYHR
eukprot:SAG22_NODE_957_length_6316_cov_2.176130_10_plen_107_part_00